MLRESCGEPDEFAVQAWRWRVEPPGPPLIAALLAGEALRDAVWRQARREGALRLPDRFHGAAPGKVDRDPSHGHAFWLSEDEDGDGLIDHMLLFAESGVPQEVLALLPKIRRLQIGGHEWRLSPDWMGRRETGGLFGPSSKWEALTPYVTPWRILAKNKKRRPDFALDRQLCRELNQRRFPPLVALSCSGAGWRGDEIVLASGFAMERKNAKPAKDGEAAFPSLIFSEPVPGPLALGYGAHFGLGLMVPA